MRIFNKIDTPYTPETQGGIAGGTHPHNLEQFYITRCKTLAKNVDENLKYFFKTHYLPIVKYILLGLILVIS